ncbi:hypothetical protein ILUMI_24589 [Ignelater luminosus]|uniref:MADF domain-containing protein n=1 Tax=Ignelater luminosus TaxID=2038154 RepID=A0A8K0C8V5_IGNLU|nr:hypothetical protein ILUMI_24589 [Ignelater luminosus]
MRRYVSTLKQIEIQESKNDANLYASAYQRPFVSITVSFVRVRFVPINYRFLERSKDRCYVTLRATTNAGYFRYRTRLIMEWTSKLTFELINKYKENANLWDANDPNYYNKLAKQEAWIAIATYLNTTTDECKKKMQSLLASLRREKGKIINRRKEGDAYRSSWFAFSKMAFLLNRRKVLDAPSADDNPDEPNSEGYPYVKIEIDENKPTADIAIENANDNSQTDTVSCNKRKDESETSLTDIYRPSKKKTKIEKESRSKETFYISKQALTAINDECQNFGKYVAVKLRNYSTRTRCAVQHAISNIIFNADLGNLENYQPNQETVVQSSSGSCQNTPIASVYLPESTHMQHSTSSPGSHASSYSSDEYNSENEGLDFNDL